MDVNKTIIRKNSKIPTLYIINAKNHKLGRLSSKVAHVLKNKNNPYYLPYEEEKSNIIIINSKHIKVTGKKYKEKEYRKHSGRPGGLKIEKLNKIHQKLPNRIIEHAVKGMLPKNTLGRNLFKKIKIYPDHLHPYQEDRLIEIK